MKNYGLREEDFDNYLNDRLSPESRLAFEAEIAADPELAELLDLHRAAQKALDIFRAAQIREIWKKPRKG